MLWEHEPQASVSTAFSSSPKPSPLQNTPKENNEKRRKLDSFIYHQNVHSLSHAMYMSFEFKLLCVSIEL